MGDMSWLSGLAQGGQNLMSGLGNVGNDLSQGAQSLFGGTGPGGFDLGLGPTPGAAFDNVSSLTGPAAGAVTGGIPGMFTGPGNNLAFPAINSGYLPEVANPTSISGPVGDLSTVAPVDANAAGTIGQPGFLQKLLSDPKMLLGGGMLGLDLLKANQKPPGLGPIQALAQQQGAFAKNQGELALAEQQGLLPQGAQNMFQGVLNANEAAIRSKYASMGMTGSTAEMQDLAAAREGILGQMQQAGLQMAQEGWANVNQATGYESQLLTESMQAQLQQQKDVQDALAEFAGAFTDMGGKWGGGGTGLTLKRGPDGTLQIQ